MQSALRHTLFVLAVLPASAVLVCATTVTLDLGDLNPGNVNGPLFIQSPYQSSGFSISSTLGFDTYGSGLSGFFAGAKSLAPIGGSSVELKAVDSSVFSLTSIGLARNFAFDPAPSVTFIGMLQNGGTVNQTFTVTTQSGTAAFQTFSFSNFNNVVAVDWSQPADPTLGLHQFTDVVLQTGAVVTPVPEPSSMTIVVLAGLCAAIRGYKLKRGGD